MINFTLNMNYLTMTQKEVTRHGIIQKLIDKEINGTVASKILKLSIRHIKRLKLKVASSGANGLIHQNRGKVSNRKIPKEEYDKIANILTEKYPDFGPTFAAEKLQENHDIDRDTKTIRSIMIEEELWKPNKKKKREYHSWRQRKDCFGQMQQFDGSYHDWFEGRAEKPEYCLLASIDDATGIPTKAKFDDSEGVFPVFAFWKEYIQKHGKPKSIYLDKFSTYKMNQRVAIENHDTQTQFQRAMKQLGIDPISAHSPQAKGRIEKLFHTFQDRLVKEMRLRNIDTVPEANHFLETEFLPSYAKKYGVTPKNPTDLHQSLSETEIKNLDSIFSKQDMRVVRNDFTVSFKNQWYQLSDNQPVTVRKKDTIGVEERLDGTIHFSLRSKYLDYQIITERSKKVAPIPWVIPAKRTIYIPAVNHPWRQKFATPKLSNV